MDVANGDVVNPPETERPSQLQLERVESATFMRPCLDLFDDTPEAREQYLKFCVPLYKCASEGNWEKARPMLLDSNILLHASIAQGWTTVLHVAAGAGNVHFVKELLDMMDENHFDLEDERGNTALCFAAISGNLEIAKLLYQANHFLPKKRNGAGFTPLLFAALQGKADVANYLFPLTADDENFEEVDWNKTFLTCIGSGIYDLALKMLRERRTLAFARDEDCMTGLHIMAKKTADLGSDNPEHQNQLSSSGTKRTIALQLVRLLWEEILTGVRSREHIREMINEPKQLLVEAAIVGNFEFLAELMKAYPDLIWQFDRRLQSIIHIAVLYRHPKIFNLIHAYSANKDIILAYEDENDRNNILHLAAKLAPRNRLELVSGAALQMKLELLWFQEVKKIVQPSYVNQENSNSQTPHDLFTEEHAKLREAAELWMRETAEKCMIVSTLITTGVLAAAFTVPGGISDSGTPNHLWKASFMVFSISDTIALISSSASILAFLSILVSRFAEYDFYKSLPSKLIFGLITLFVSISSMMVAFSSAFFVTYDHAPSLKWVPCFISVLSFLPIAIFVGFKYRHFYDIIYSTSYLSSLFKPSKHVLY
ncbi:hypothetical protein K1719_002425 [Acacia pycnantha]|nr:hypothetical protein K1719_002425 [Acacia pycnantha]